VRLPRSGNETSKAVIEALTKIAGQTSPGTGVMLSRVGTNDWTPALEKLGGRDLLFQSVTWHRVLERTYGFDVERYLADDYQGRPVGAIATVRITLPHEIKHVSLPFSDYAGPVGCDLAAMNATLEGLHLHIGELPFTVRLAAENVNCAPDASVVRLGYVHRIDLHQSEQRLQERMSDLFRRNIRKAERSGVTIRFDSSVEAFLRFWNIHAALRRTKFQEIPQPRKFFEALADEFGGKGFGGVAEAWLGDRCVAGIVYLIAGRRVHYKFAASAADALQYRVNNLLLWRSVLNFQQQGFESYDLGLTGASTAYAGLRRYKQESGAEEMALRFVAFNRNETESPNALVWREFMQDLTHRIAGDPALGESSLDGLSESVYKFLA
jgi:CelD/BcsL family acetyltransferase involved in cellulose biosynthesis